MFYGAARPAERNSDMKLLRLFGSQSDRVLFRRESGAEDTEDMIITEGTEKAGNTVNIGTGDAAGHTRDAAGHTSSAATGHTGGGASVGARIVCAACVLVLLGSLCTGIRAIGLDAEIYDRILRLHVIADSDSDADQAVKLKVRDAVLELMGEVMEACPDISEAQSIAERMAPEAERTANRVLEENGFSYGASVTLGYEYYPTRDYGSFSLPAGRYLSYRIVLGSGQGHNWWCVLFPSLCTAPAERQEDKFVTAGFTPGQIGVLSGKKSPKYVVRFRLLELFGALGEKLHGD